MDYKETIRYFVLTTAQRQRHYVNIPRPHLPSLGVGLFCRVVLEKMQQTNVQAEWNQLQRCRFLLQSRGTTQVCLTFSPRLWKGNFYEPLTFLGCHQKWGGCPPPRPARPAPAVAPMNCMENPRKLFCRCWIKTVQANFPINRKTFPTKCFVRVF